EYYVGKEEKVEAAPVDVTEKSEVHEAEEEQNRKNSIVDNVQRMSLGIDFNLRKAVTIAGMFLVMVVIPVAVSEGKFDPNNISPKQVYTADALAEEGRVAGISTQASVQNNTNKLFDREIAGLSMGLVFIILGFIFIALPTVAILR